MRTGVVTSFTFRIRVFRLNPCLFVEYINTQGHPSTFGGISFAAKDFFIKFGGEILVINYSNMILIFTDTQIQILNYLLPNVKKSSEHNICDVPMISVFSSKSSLVIVINFESFALDIVSLLHAFPISSSRTFIPSRISS